MSSEVEAVVSELASKQKRLRRFGLSDSLRVLGREYADNLSWENIEDSRITERVKLGEILRERAEKEFADGRTGLYMDLTKMQWMVCNPLKKKQLMYEKGDKDVFKGVLKEIVNLSNEAERKSQPGLYDDYARLFFILMHEGEENRAEEPIWVFHREKILDGLRKGADNVISGGLSRQEREDDNPYGVRNRVHDELLRIRKRVKSHPQLTPERNEHVRRQLGSMPR